MINVQQSSDVSWVLLNPAFSKLKLSCFSTMLDFVLEVLDFCEVKVLRLLHSRFEFKLLHNVRKYNLKGGKKSPVQKLLAQQ